jgi:hypothetical protein
MVSEAVSDGQQWRAMESNGVNIRERPYPAPCLIKVAVESQGWYETRNEDFLSIVIQQRILSVQPYSSSLVNDVLSRLPIYRHLDSNIHAAMPSCRPTECLGTSFVRASSSAPESWPSGKASCDIVLRSARPTRWTAGCGAVSLGAEVSNNSDDS